MYGNGTSYAGQRMVVSSDDLITQVKLGQVETGGATIAGSLRGKRVAFGWNGRNVYITDHLSIQDMEDAEIDEAARAGKLFITH